MKKTPLSLLVLLAICGCGESGVEQAADAPPQTENAAVTTNPSGDDEPAAPSPETSAVPGTEISNDASELLAASLDAAKANQKRVLVHLGAPG